MSITRRFPSALAAVVATLAICSSSASAAIVTVGSPIEGAPSGNISCIGPCTFSQNVLPGATLTSPVDGMVIGWSMVPGSDNGKYRLRVLNPAGGLQFTAVGSSAVVDPFGAGIPEFFETAIPIHAGQAIGLDVEPNGPISIREVPGAHDLIFQPPLGDGSTATGLESSGFHLLFNASVQPVPRVVDLAPASGPLSGGVTVVISGADFLDASAVSFGGVPASSFQVTTEDQITAVVPPGSQPGPVPVSVTTVAGTATSPVPFTYVEGSGGGGGGGGGGSGGGGPGSSSCVVPKLRGKRLIAAKRRLKKAHCALGKVRKKARTTAKRGRVVAQRPKPGSVLPVGAKVKLTLGPGRRGPRRPLLGP
jgi:IPT/TIG domain/PASTA domain